ncbi:MAG: Rho-binding antiterminator [Pseudomonadales bacterium]
MISCDQQDYIEIVCLYNYPISLTLKNGDIFAGIAINTQNNEHREECIEIDSQGEHLLIALESISEMEVNVANPHVQLVEFS